MEAKSAQVVYASSGLKYTDPYTRCFLMNIAPGVTEAQIQRQFSRFGAVQIYTYQPAVGGLPGWAWVGFYSRLGVLNMQSAALAKQKASAEFAARYGDGGILSSDEKRTAGVEEEEAVGAGVPQSSVVGERKLENEDDIGDKLDTSTTHADTEPPNSPAARIIFQEGGAPQE
ncbi:rna binding [Cystoisospora suis]|uniref:Rna binding n=1 Tax=Cystoisospora suis TaxID=483139 RepID=A0A2C6KP30_9APIC|nr:rna binding [Cystoisospora suis]